MVRVGLLAIPVGIELADGRFEIIIPKGTSYPTGEPFRVSLQVGHDSRIAVRIYQGFEQIARRNELQAELVIPADGSFPPDARLPAGTPFEVDLYLDENGVLGASVRSPHPILNSCALVRPWEKDDAASGKKSVPDRISSSERRGRGHNRNPETRRMTEQAPVAADGQHRRALFLGACLLNGGRPAEAERVLRGVTGAGAAPMLAVACARQGRAEEAAAIFRDSFKRNPKDECARASLVALLHRLAVQKINTKNWSEAGAALGEVLTVDPDHREVKALLATIQNVLPIALLQAGKRQEAAGEWEKAQRARPGDAQVAHSLALLHFFWASRLEGTGRGADTEPLWNKAIANWAFVRYNDAFWANWVASRSAIYPISAEALATLRRNWMAELEKRLRQLASESEVNFAEAKVATYQKQKEKWRNIEMRCWLEQVVACVLHELRKTPCPGCKLLTAAVPDERGALVCDEAGCRKPLPDWRPAHDVPVAGPLLLGQLLAESQAAALGMSKLPNGNVLSESIKMLLKGGLPFLKTNADVLRFCLSSCGVGLGLVVHARYEEALPSIVKAAGKKASADSNILALYTCLERGKQLAALFPQLVDDPGGDAANAYVAAVKAALEQWKAALPYRSANQGLAEELVERIENASSRGGNEFYARAGKSAREGKWDRAIGLVTHGIDLLEFALKIDDLPRIRETVSVLYADRGLWQRQRNANDSGTGRAIEDWRTALRHSPQNARAKELLAEAINDKGVKLLKPYQGSAPSNVLREAQGYFREAKELAPNDDAYRRNYEIVTRAL